MIVRDEAPADHAAVHALVHAAFGQADEAVLVDRLRETGDSRVSLVAEEEDGVIVGHILLSEMSAPFRALGLAPVSVTPERQGQGLGSRLIEAAIERARAMGYAAIVVLGDQAYYGRFGFEVEAAEGYASPYAGPHLALLRLTDEALPKGRRLDYAPPFEEGGL